MRYIMKFILLLLLNVSNTWLPMFCCCSAPVRFRTDSYDANDLRSGHILLEIGLILAHALIDFLDCVRPGITILFLKQASEDIEFSSGSFQIVVGKFAPPSFGLAPDLFPLAF